MGRLGDLAERVQQRSVHGRTLALLAAATRREYRNRRGDDSNAGGVRHSGKLDMERSVAYVEAQFDQYLAQARRRYPDFTFSGARVLEVGPGDTDAVAVLMVAAGATEVVAIDRFRPHRDEAHNEALCAAVLERFDRPDTADPLDAAAARDRVTYIHGQALETADVETLGTFDVVVSDAVLEHVYDLPASLAAIGRLTGPGGVLLHNVDLSEHGLFATHGHHPLTHLTVPERAYRRIVRPGGAPNRALPPVYRQCLDQLGFDAEVRVTRNVFRDPNAPEIPAIRDTAADEELAAIRPALRPEFADHSAEDLNAAGIFIVARRPD